MVFKSQKEVIPSPNDDELRKRIFANASILFPNTTTICPASQFEIVYGITPLTTPKAVTDGQTMQYALLRRRTPEGGHAPLIRGPMYTSNIALSSVLQGLLETTGGMIHRAFGKQKMPELGIHDTLPTYSLLVEQTTTQATIHIPTAVI